MKRLVAKHDWHNRDVAIVVFGDEVYEDATHSICLQRYLQDYNEKKGKKVFNIIDISRRPSSTIFKEVSEVNGGQNVILAHKVDNYNSVYYIYGFSNGEEMNNGQIEKKLKQVFSDKEIINDLEHVNDGNNEGYNEDDMLARGMGRLDEYETELKNKDKDTKKSPGQIVSTLTDEDFVKNSNGIFVNGFGVYIEYYNNDLIVRTIDGTKDKKYNCNNVDKVIDDYSSYFSSIPAILEGYGFEDKTTDEEIVFEKQDLRVDFKDGNCKFTYSDENLNNKLKESGLDKFVALDGSFEDLLNSVINLPNSDEVKEEVNNQEDIVFNDEDFDDEFGDLDLDD